MTPKQRSLRETELKRDKERLATARDRLLIAKILSDDQIAADTEYEIAVLTNRIAGFKQQLTET